MGFGSKGMTLMSSKFDKHGRVQHVRYLRPRFVAVCRGSGMLVYEWVGTTSVRPVKMHYHVARCSASLTIVENSILHPRTWKYLSYLQLNASRLSRGVGMEIVLGSRPMAHLLCWAAKLEGALDIARRILYIIRLSSHQIWGCRRSFS